MQVITLFPKGLQSFLAFSEPILMRSIGQIHINLSLKDFYPKKWPKDIRAHTYRSLLDHVIALVSMRTRQL